MAFMPARRSREICARRRRFFSRPVSSGYPRQSKVAMRFMLVAAVASEKSNPILAMPRISTQLRLEMPPLLGCLSCEWKRSLAERMLSYMSS